MPTETAAPANSYSTIAGLQKAIEQDPHDATLRFTLAHSLHQHGDMHGAAAAWLAGIEIDPGHLAAHLGLADALAALGLHDSAVIAARQALLVDPESPDARRQLAGLLQAEGNLEQARDLLERLTESRAAEPGDHFRLAVVLAQQGARQQAIDRLRRAIQVQPHFPEALNNLGSLLRAERQLPEAEACLRRAVRQKPRFAAAWNNLGNLYLELSRLSEAERCYSKAIAEKPGFADAHTSRAMLWLLNGKLEEGWEEYEWRWRQAGRQPRTLPKPAWDGSSLEGKTILLHAEQGAGDTIQFIRYARVLKRQGASVIVHCPESLQPLLKAMPEIAAAVSGQEVVPPFDVHASLLSLPRLCGTSLPSIPSEIPYLNVPAGVRIPELLTGKSSPRVAIVWAGNPNHHNDHNRTCPPELFEPLVRTENIHFFSLQMGADHFRSWLAANRICDLSTYLTNYAVTAGCLAEMDLLITVDTSVAHLAGALGRPVWLLLPVCNDWRWMRGRSDSPWYPTMRIFRQKSLGDWGAVFAEVSSAIKCECRKDVHD